LTAAAASNTRATVACVLRRLADFTPREMTVGCPVATFPTAAACPLENWCLGNFGVGTTGIEVTELSAVETGLAVSVTGAPSVPRRMTRLLTYFADCCCLLVKVDMDRCVNVFGK
jgi:hypothetical protein